MKKIPSMERVLEQQISQKISDESMEVKYFVHRARIGSRNRGAVSLVEEHFAIDYVFGTENVQKKIQLFISGSC